MIKLENDTNGRYYYIKEMVDLLGDPILLIVRGGKGKCVIRTYGFTDDTERSKKIDGLIRRRIRNGYFLLGVL